MMLRQGESICSKCGEKTRPHQYLNNVTVCSNCGMKYPDEGWLHLVNQSEFALKDDAKMSKKKKFKSFVEWYCWALKEARKEYKKTGRVPDGFESI